VSLPGTIFKGVTDADGSFVIGKVPAASWRMKVEMAGYEPMVTDAYEIESGHDHDMGTMIMSP
jgi:hypothetical protein